MKLSKLGVWTTLDPLDAAASAELAQRIEKWGYSAIWQAEGMGRNVLVHSGWLLAKTSTLIVATGIANIYARDALAMAGAQYGLAEQSGGRFLLGMGVSHAPLVTGLRGHNYGKPIAAMRDYLLAMRAVSYGAPQPAEKPPTLIAALGPKMLELAAELADGVHPYNVTPDHTAKARAILGPDKLLCVEQKVILETDPDKARTAARKLLGFYLTLENYRANWLRMGFDENEMDNGGSDRLIDAMFAWGDEDAIRARLQEHWDAGADHVCIHAVDPVSGASLDERALAALAPTR